MPDMRSKVAYERAALLVDAEIKRHNETGDCEYCGIPTICIARLQLIKLAEDIRFLKRKA